MEEVLELVDLTELMLNLVRGGGGYGGLIMLNLVRGGSAGTLISLAVQALTVGRPE